MNIIKKNIFQQEEVRIMTQEHTKGEVYGKQEHYTFTGTSVW